MNFDYSLLRQYKEIIDAVESTMPPEAFSVQAIIAGGAVRDMLLEKPIKDIDVFYIGTLDEDLLKLKFSTVDNNSSLAYEGSDFLVSHPTLTYEGCPYPIQLIKVNADHFTEWMCESFGCNLSKVAYGGEDLIITKEFLDDVELEILTFPKPVSQKYMNKMTEKFPDYLINGEVDECPF